jgi:trk system potassium uptake protein TrkA
MRKYIVIGLGNFGGTLAKALTDFGDEVIAVDIDINKVENVKDLVSQAVALDTRELHAIDTLPISEVDAVIVCIGENFEASVMTIAQLKQLKAKKIIGRTMSPLHTSVLESLKIDEILLPEQEAALKLAKRLDMPNVQNSITLNDYFSIVEIKAPERYLGQKIEDIKLKSRYNLEIIALKKFEKKRNIFGLESAVYNISDNCQIETLEKQDILVVYGKNQDITKMTSEF